MPNMYKTALLTLCITLMTTSTAMTQARPNVNPQKVQLSNSITVKCAPAFFKKERVKLHKQAKLALAQMPTQYSRYKIKSDLFVKNHIEKTQHHARLLLKCFRPTAIGRTAAIKGRLQKIATAKFDIPPKITRKPFGKETQQIKEYKNQAKACVCKPAHMSAPTPAMS